MNIEEKERLLNQIERTAQSYEEEYGGCAKNTLAGIQRHLELCDEDTAQKMFQACDALAGGVGYHQKMCGAAIAGVMAISLVCGPERMEKVIPQDDSKPTEAMLKHRDAVKRSHDFVTRFEKAFDGVNCRDVQYRVTGRYWDMLKQEDLALFITKPYHDQCGRVTGKAARLAAEVILELEGQPIVHF